jgi:hypothetical protein
MTDEPRPDDVSAPRPAPPVAVGMVVAPNAYDAVTDTGGGRRTPCWPVQGARGGGQRGAPTATLDFLTAAACDLSRTSDHTQLQTLRTTVERLTTIATSADEQPNTV